jgi:DNA repair exonuclease SbcCD ATPase subunit
MIINSISIRNFKSYGNNLQKLSFSKDGSLILLTGANGNGKSSLLESIDFALFNIVRGKNTKRVPSYILPNRTNKNLETEIDFVNWNNDNIIINRKLNPKGFKISINGFDKTDKYELMQQDEKDDILGIEYNTYKSLVSLNLADFANFINLDTDTKRKLLNKLFNIEEIDNYQSIAKELLKNTYKRKEKLETIVISNENSIITYNNNIKIILEKSGNYINKEEIKQRILKYKSEFIPLKNELKDLRNNVQQLNSELKSKSEILNAKKNKISEDEFILGELNKKIEIFQGGSCPFCGSELTGDHHEKELENLLKTHEESKGDLLFLKRGYNDVRIEISSKIDERKIISNEINEKEIRFDFLKDEIKDLREQYEKNPESISINELNKTIENIENKNIKFNRALKKLEEKINRYTKLVDILSEKGIRKNIIKTVVNPINEHLAKYLIELESMYNVRLDDSFDAIIKERYIDDIHIESLSTGEARKINIAIALSYMEMVISMNKKTNILFMDEVFASVDEENVDLILKALRKFSTANNINVIIATPLNFDTAHFDRVIKVEKYLGYSMIREN